MARLSKREFALKDFKPLIEDVILHRKMIPMVKEHLIEPQRTALLVVDLNNVSAHRDYGVGPKLGKLGFNSKKFYDKIDKVVIPNTQRLIRACREAGIRVVYSRMGYTEPDMSDLPIHWKQVYPQIGYDESTPGKKAFEFRPEVMPQEGEPVVLKRGSVAFIGTELDQILKDWSVDTLLITGVETDCCVYNTAICAVDMGYKCIMVDDACATLTETGHNVFLWGLGVLFFFNVRDTQEVIEDIKKAAVKTPVSR